MTRRLMRATIDLLSAEQGGRTGPIESGYRSLIRFDGSELDFGVELALDASPLPPGASGSALLSFWAVDELPNFGVGQRFQLREGTSIVGRGTVDDPEAVS